MDRGDIAQRLGVANMQGDKLLDAVQAIVNEVRADQKRLVRSLDMLLNGAGAAEQASLCGIVAQVRSERIRSINYFS